MNTRLEKLAVAMGRNPGTFAPNHDTLIFNPFEDANHDYAVLEWAWKDESRLSDFKDAMHTLNGCLSTRNRPWNYKIGDYARACLKVLEAEK